MPVHDQTPKTKQVRVQVPTHKLVLAIVELYKMEDLRAKDLAADLAGCILESYDSKEDMIKDIIGTYVTQKSIISAMKGNIKRMYKEESKILSEIFGVFLFGEKL